jgi:hypothetical protein
MSTGKTRGWELRFGRKGGVFIERLASERARGRRGGSGAGLTNSAHEIGWIRAGLNLKIIEFIVHCFKNLGKDKNQLKYVKN